MSAELGQESPAAASPPLLRGSAEPLSRCYDVALLDLDGVVYLGQEPIPGVAPALEQARAAGMRLAYVTNNASRRPEQVAAMLQAMDIPARAADVVTSAQAAAHLLAQRLAPGSAVLIVGGDALRDTVRDAGLTPVASADDRPVAVVQGYSPEVGWPQLAEAMVALRAGAQWVATNGDSTFPSVRGPLPGNGAMVAALRHATGEVPLFVGKPERTLHAEAVARTAARHPLVVGDRLDTDIEGATRSSTDSLLVLTGVTRPADLLSAPPEHRPTYLARGLDGLLTPHPEVVVSAGTARCGGYLVESDDQLLHLGTHSGEAPPAGERGADDPSDEMREDDLDALRALCCAAWQRLDGGARVDVRAADPAAAGALERLELAQGTPVR